MIGRVSDVQLGKQYKAIFAALTTTSTTIQTQLSAMKVTVDALKTAGLGATDGQVGAIQTAINDAITATGDHQLALANADYMTPIHN